MPGWCKGAFSTDYWSLWSVKGLHSTVKSWLSARAFWFYFLLDERIGIKLDRKQMANWLFLGNASQSVSRWWKASKGQRNLWWFQQFQSTFPQTFSSFSLSSFLRKKVCGQFSRRQGSDLIRTLGFLGAEAAQQEPIKAQFMQCSDGEFFQSTKTCLN